MDLWARVYMYVYMHASSSTLHGKMYIIPMCTELTRSSCWLIPTMDGSSPGRRDNTLDLKLELPRLTFPGCAHE